MPFDEAWASHYETVIAGHTIAILGIEALRKNKAAAGRDKDLADLKAIDRLKPR